MTSLRPQPYRPIRMRAARALSLAALCTAATAGWAGTITVNSLADPGAAGQCTLRKAVGNANANGQPNADCAAGTGVDTILFAVNGTITLGAELAITDAAALTIDGTGHAVAISGNDSVRALVVESSSALTLNNLTITHARAGGLGGSIWAKVLSNLTVANSTFSNNTSGQLGGAILVEGATLTVTNSTFTGNHATAGISGGYGGAIALRSDASATITDSTFTSNTATGLDKFPGWGAAITLFESAATIDRCTFAGNTATGGPAGGSGGGGAIMMASPAKAVTVTNSTFAGNSATGGNNPAGPGGLGHGGAITLLDGALTVANSTFNANTATGGAGTTAVGGAINDTAGPVSITSSTFYGNAAISGAGGPAPGATLDENYGSAGPFTLSNSIVAGGTGSGNCAGNFVNGGNNIDDGTSCGFGSANGSRSSTNPLLGPLAANGGPTQTMALLAGSPAIDGVTFNVPNGVPSSDQRGVARPQGQRYDIGAFEVAVTSAPVPTLRESALIALGLLLFAAGGFALHRAPRR